MRWGRRAIVAGLVAVATLAAATGTACACSCVGLTDEEALRNSAAAFVGTLREVRGPTVSMSSSDPSRFVFDVEAVYKGAVHEVQSIVSASDGGSCGLEVNVGERALVFAHGSGQSSLLDGEYAAGLCEGTRMLGVAAVPPVLGAPIAMLPGSSVVGEDDSIPSVVVRNWYWVVGFAALIGGVAVVRRRRRSPVVVGE